MATEQQIPGLTRTDLQREDISVPGREMIQNRVDIGPEALRNVGDGNAAELTTYIVEKDKPFLVVVD